MRSLVIAGVLLCVLGIARMAGVVFHQPMAGYANTFDFIRLEGCLGLYPDLPEPQRYAGHPAAPLETYARGAPRPSNCQPNSAIAFAAAALAAHGVAQGGEARMDLRWVGGATLAFAAALVLFVAWRLRAHPVASLVHGLLVAAVLGDPLVSLYFNTLYAEAATFLGLYLMLALLAAVALRGRLTAADAAGVAVGATILGLSKEQFFLLPLALLAAFALMAGRPAARSRAFLGCVAAALVPVALFAFPAIDTQRPNAAYRIDAYLGALAASSDDVPRTLARLGLPRRCEVLVGASFLRMRGEDVREACPEVVTLPLGAFLPLAASEPLTLARAAAALGVQSQNAFSGYVGILAGREYAAPESLAAWSRSLWTPLFHELPAAAYVALLAGVLGASLAFAFAAGARAAAMGSAWATLLGLLGLVIAYTLATALVGDGFVDAAKHVNAAALALAAWLVAASAGLAALGATGAGWRHVTAAAAVVAVALAAGTAQWMRGQPLGFGVIDEPADNRFADAALRGWALDPRGVAAVEVEVDGVRVPARYGLDYPGVARVFPALPHAARSGFEASLPPAMLRPGATVRVVLVNSRGVRSEVDRRRVGAPP